MVRLKLEFPPVEEDFAAGLQLTSGFFRGK
jgi:hypothetical protein